MVWQALTDPAHLSEWAPFDADRNLGTAGPVKLSTVGTPKPQISETVDSSRCAAGWHICFDVLDRLLAGEPLGRIVGPDAMKFGWPRLNAEYATQFGVEPPSWPSHSRS